MGLTAAPAKTGSRARPPLQRLGREAVRGHCRAQNRRSALPYKANGGAGPSPAGRFLPSLTQLSGGGSDSKREAGPGRNSLPPGRAFAGPACFPLQQRLSQCSFCGGGGGKLGTCTPSGLLHQPALGSAFTLLSPVTSGGPGRVGGSRQGCDPHAQDAAQGGRAPLGGVGAGEGMPRMLARNPGGAQGGGDSPEGRS